MNERDDDRLKAWFPHNSLVGFGRVVLVSALALSAGLPDTAGASGKRTATVTKPITSQQVGQASWYGPGFHGKKTASGQTFDQHRLTAAHPRLPLGTRARVTNLHNGKAVDVTINDRGPHGGGRIIDLSRAAARRLAMGGTARVKIEALP